MTTEEKEIFLFAQTNNIIAARLGNSSQKLNAKSYMENNFQGLYNLLDAQFSKCCPNASKK